MVCVLVVGEDKSTDSEHLGDFCGGTTDYHGSFGTPYNILHVWHTEHEAFHLQFISDGQETKGGFVLQYKVNRADPLSDE